MASVLRLGSGDAKLTAAPSAILFSTTKASATSAGHAHGTGSGGGGGGGAAAGASERRAVRGAAAAGGASGGDGSDTSSDGSGGGGHLVRHMATPGAPRSMAVRVQLAAWDGAHTPLERVVATTVLVLRDGIALDSRVIGKLPLGGTSTIRVALEPRAHGTHTAQHVAIKHRVRSPTPRIRPLHMIHRYAHMIHRHADMIHRHAHTHSRMLLDHVHSFICMVRQCTGRSAVR